MAETVGVEAEYHFTLYGAAAGTGISTDGGYGGVAEGARSFDPGTTLYVVVGGEGDSGGTADTGSCNTRIGGFNGGGRGSQGGSAGGGGTDLRLTVGDLDSRILVAGGGGGCGYESCFFYGGDGGGLAGELPHGGGAGAGDGLVGGGDDALDGVVRAQRA